MRKDTEGKCQVKWIIDDLNQKRWICLNQMPPYSKHHENSEKCWKYNCKGRSMNGYPVEVKPVDIKMSSPPVEDDDICISIVCNNKKSPRSKFYCSDNCRKRAHEQRKKGLLKR